MHYMQNVYTFMCHAHYILDSLINIIYVGKRRNNEIISTVHGVGSTRKEKEGNWRSGLGLKLGLAREIYRPTMDGPPVYGGFDPWCTVTQSMRQAGLREGRTPIRFPDPFGPLSLGPS